MTTFSGDLLKYYVYIFEKWPDAIRLLKDTGFKRI